MVFGGTGSVDIFFFRLCSPFRGQYFRIPGEDNFQFILKFIVYANR